MLEVRVVVSLELLPTPPGGAPTYNVRAELNNQPVRLNVQGWNIWCYPF